MGLLLADGRIFDGWLGGIQTFSETERESRIRPLFTLEVRQQKGVEFPTGFYL
jgi:hypothetical protein